MGWGELSGVWFVHRVFFWTGGALNSRWTLAVSLRCVLVNFLITNKNNIVIIIIIIIIIIIKRRLNAAPQACVLMAWAHKLV